MCRGLCFTPFIICLKSFAAEACSRHCPRHSSLFSTLFGASLHGCMYVSQSWCSSRTNNAHVAKQKVITVNDLVESGEDNY